MLALERMLRETARRVEVLLFDLDDTLLTHGVLTRAAYVALWELHEAGIGLVAVTGRPAGWGEVIARQWPVLGVVAENGAVSIHRAGEEIVRSARGTESSRREDARRRAAIAEELAGLGLETTDDVGARLTDTTFDIGERRQVPRELVDRARAIIQRHGARSIVSSVHLHATYEGDDKASGALRFLGERRAMDASVARTRCAFVGDSENDAACFGCFTITIGVANVARYVARLSVPPRYVTVASYGDGFAELARALLAARRSA